jgi:hypothetical protein
LCGINSRKFRFISVRKGLGGQDGIEKNRENRVLLGFHLRLTWEWVVKARRNE